MIIKKHLTFMVILVLFFSSIIAGCKKNVISQENKQSIDWSLPVIYNPQGSNISNQTKLSKLLKNPKFEYILLYFWATWNEPDNAELIYLEKLFQAYREKGLLVVGISIDTTKDPEMIISKLRDLKSNDGSPFSISYPILWDNGNIVRKLYNISVMPYRLILDKNNKTIYERSIFSVDSMLDLENKIKELLP